MGVYLSLPPPVKIDRINARKSSKSALNIIQPTILIAFVISPCRSIKTNIPKTTRFPNKTTRWTSGRLDFLIDHVIKPRPNAQAPDSRTIICPVRLVVRPRRNKLKTGTIKKNIALTKVRIAAIVVIVLYLMVSLYYLINARSFYEILNFLVI